ncbi:P-loop NTPase fold protein [Actinocrispum wychmicini]|uniref:UvrB/UvrC motif-containing protein n=1 Tax=Actinocrispum wychmicini TaxID=1213861 RepID=A0A4R2JPF2_9PSEU|nr:P-loop NTPase fold protein [Actinocrispum wychmicini]TCO56045.1 UvrB/UvrC motif-containing protein [Actinocrispum wychmicini]
MFERFTDRARRVVVLAQEEARLLNHDQIGTEHFLVGLILENEGVAAKALESLGIALEGVRQQVEEIVGQGQHGPSGHIPFTPRAKTVLELSLRESLQLGHNYIGTEHILLGLIREGAGVAAQVLVKLGVDLNRVSQQVLQLLSGYQQAELGSEGAGTPSSSLVLDQFGRNLLASAREGRLDPVIGRSQEIERVMQVLSRRTKNNPVLVSEPGVGATKVVEGLAWLIVRGEVPETLRGKQLCTLDVSSLAAGSAEDIRGAIKQIRTRGDVILFIDEIHTLLGTDADPQLSAARSIVKPMLIRGELQVIGATTADEYHRYVAKDPALDRSCQPIQVGEPTLEQAVEILKGVRDRYEAHHRVSITNLALVAAVTLASRYVSDRPLPESALDLIDKAGARMRIRRMPRSPDLRELDEKIADVRRQKEELIEAQDFEAAALMRDEEKQLLGQQTQHEQRWQSDDIDVVPSVDEDEIIQVVAEDTGIPADTIRDTWSPEAETYQEPTADENGYNLLNDQPVADVAGDLLGTTETAEGIASILIRTPSPFVMAVDGGWGAGKSTLLRQIQAALPDSPSLVQVSFNAWTARGENALDSLIKSVIAKLDARLLRRWIRKLSKGRHTLAFLRFGFSVAARFFGVSRLADELWAKLEVNAKSRNELRNWIQEILEDWTKKSGLRAGRNLVVFIDDLDRCSDDVVVHICEAVKLYLATTGVIFVIGCDLSVLARGVSTSARGGEGEGRTYLEKIVQVVYRIPVPDRASTAHLVHSYAKQAGVDGFVDKTVTKILVERTEGNPRRIKRIINSFVLQQKLSPAWRKPPLGSGRLIIVIILQHLYPAVYESLVSSQTGTDPIGEFLDYAGVRARVTDPPGASDTWWSTASRVFRRHGMMLPGRTPELRGELVTNLERLERGLPAHFLELASNEALTTLLRELGDVETRLAVRAQLTSRPLSTGSFPGESFDLTSETGN